MGLFDELAGSLSLELIDLLTDEPWEFARTRIHVEPESGEETPLLVAETEAKVAPPYAFRVGQVDGSAVQAADLQTIVAAEALDGFDPVAARGERVHVTSPAGARFAVVRAEPIYSGDTVAAYGLQLRP